MLIFKPRASRIAPKEADAMPLPSEETTPPVTKTNRVMMGHRRLMVSLREATIVTRDPEPKGTIEIRREFRLPDRAALDNRSRAQRGTRVLPEHRRIIPSAPEAGL